MATALAVLEKNGDYSGAGFEGRRPEAAELFDGLHFEDEIIHEGAVLLPIGLVVGSQLSVMPQAQMRDEVLLYLLFFNRHKGSTVGVQPIYPAALTNRQSNTSLSTEMRAFHISTRYPGELIQVLTFYWNSAEDF